MLKHEFGTRSYAEEGRCRSGRAEGTRRIARLGPKVAPATRG